MNTVGCAGTEPRVSELPVWRLNLLRAMYLVLVIGLGATVVPDIVSHGLRERGVIASLLGAVWLLAIVGLRYPQRMLPLLLFEFVWKLLWMLAYGLSQWTSGQRPPTFADDFFNIALGVILVPLVLPWPWLWRHYARARAERWR